MEGRFFPSLRGRDVLLLSHMSTVANQIILIHETVNSVSAIVNSNSPHINVQNDILFNTLINLQKETDTNSSVSVNDEINDDNNISEEISSHQNLAEMVDHTCDDNGNNLLSTA